VHRKDRPKAICCHLDAGKKRMIAERYAKGETLEQLAEDYECGVATVWRALRPFEQNASV